MKETTALYIRAINRLAKWRMILASWQLGTRLKDDPECQAVRDQREMLLLLRVEVTALSSILFKRGLLTPEHFEVEVANEAQHLMKALEAKFPGAVATDDGMDIDIAKAQPWMSKFPP